MHAYSAPDQTTVEHFTEQGWQYYEYSNGVCILSRLETSQDGLVTRLWNRLRGEPTQPIRSNFTLVYDTIVGKPERPEGAFQQTFTLYRNGMKIGSVDDNMLPPVIEGKFRDQTIPYEDWAAQN